MRIAAHQLAHHAVLVNRRGIQEAEKARHRLALGETLSDDHDVVPSFRYAVKPLSPS
jgi:hypothetical protein